MRASIRQRFAIAEWSWLHSVTSFSATTRAMFSRIAAKVVIVLAVAVVSVATMLAAWTAAREREVRVRTALGATVVDIIRQFLIDSVPLAGAGAVRGLGVSAVLIRIVMSRLPSDVPRMGALDLDRGGGAR